MAPMISMPRVDPLRVAGRVLAATLTAVSLLGATAQAAEPAQRLRLTPEQRRDMWERMSPEQREAWRNARSPEERQHVWQGLTPEQRRNMSEGLSPEQRELMMRRLSPEQRQDMWRNMSPEQRQAMRQRFIERRQGEPSADGAHRPQRSLTPEERQRLREQIREAQRDVYRGQQGGDRSVKGERGDNRGGGKR
jgi:hypothetical protein